MGIKSTKTIHRLGAIATLELIIPELTNGTLAKMLDLLANSGESESCSKFDNFLVTDNGKGRDFK